MLTVTSSRRLLAGLLAAVLGLVLLAPRASAGERVLLVPQDYTTVQAAVDAARTGDLVLIDEGVYHEFVTVSGDERSGITIRGVDRNAVVFDGQDDLPMAIMVKQADNVRLENMTAHNYTGNGFYWQSVEGYVGRYLTTWNIGVYGIYAFDSRLGLFEHSYGSGSSDSSFYIGQCYPCDATIRNVEAEYSIIGYSGTNAGGNLAIEDSVWNNNGAGIVPNSLDSEALAPQREAIVRNNVVTNSGQVPVPAKGIFAIAEGLGIVVAGGRGNVVEDNVVENSAKYGIVITPLPDQNVWQPADNVVRNNEVSGTASGDGVTGADLAIVAASDSGNCFEGNTFETSDPPEIETLWACSTSLADVPGGGAPIAGGQLLTTYAQAAACQEGLEPACKDYPHYTEMPPPPAQPTMPADEAGKGVPGGPDDQAAAAASGELDVPQAPTAMDPAAVQAAQAVAPASEPLPVTGGGAAALVGGLALALTGVRLRRR